MNIPMKKIAIILLSLMVVSTVSYAKDRPKENYEAYTKTYGKILKTMHKELKKAPKTGDVTIDFLYELSSHHKGTLAMVENELTNGDNPVIWQFARGIKRTHYKRKDQMELLIKQLKKEKLVDKEKEAQYLAQYEGIISEMLKEMEQADCTENVDKAYLFQMIASHKATNKLAEQFVQYSSNITVQEIATKMIERQTKELKQMEKFVREIR